MKKITAATARPLKLSMLVISGVLAGQTLFAAPSDHGVGHHFSPPYHIRKVADIVVKGTVSSANGPLAGVTVTVEGAATAVTTTDSGSYTITVPENGLLVFSYSGYAEQRIAVNKRSVINITMTATGKLEEVIVTGYRSQTRGAVIGSVSSVSGSEFANTPVDNLSNALAGRLSGATITQAAGTPGMESNIRIRAVGTINNATPLFVIDGVVSDKFAFDGLSPYEVENITILKDGASAAIYGSRAANGVILVTTKRGKEGTPKLSYNGLFGLQSPTKIPERLNAFEHASIINQQLQYTLVPATDARYYTQDELDYFKTHSWNWVDEMWKDPVTTQHSLDVSGGAKNVKYFLGGSYNKATGTFNNIDFQKLSVRGNVDVTVTKNLKISLDLNTETRNTNGPSWDVGNWRMEDLYKALMVRPAMVPPYVNGLPVGNWVEWHPGVVLTPSESGYNKRKWTGVNMIATVNYTVPFIKGLTARASINKYNRDIYNKQFNLPYNMTLFNTTGTNNHIVGDQAVGIRPRAAVEFLLSRNDKVNRYQFNAQLNYKRNFGKHGLDALLVYEQAEENTTWFSGQRNDFISSAIDQYAAGSTIGSIANGEQMNTARISYVGLASYNYDQKYLLEASFRYDGSVIFAPENRWGFFPSLSAGWRISNENFFSRVNFINDLKLRGSVGLLGNDQVGNFQWLQSYSIQPGAIFNDQSYGLKPGVLANRALTWEKSLNYNVGVDSRFLNSKVGFKLDLFYRHTYDILGKRELSLPSTLGADLPDENYQEIDSKGFEVEMDYSSSTGGKDAFNYYIRGNFGLATNKVMVLDEAQNIRAYQSQKGYNTGRIFGYRAVGILRTQKDLDALPAGYTILGVKPQLGMLNYADLRGPTSDEPDGKITADDREYIARYSSPPMNFGFSLGGSWKGLSVDILFQGVAGAKAMLPTAGRDVQARAEESSFKYWADSWTPDNPNGKYPGYRVTAYRTRFDESSFFLVDNSFLRLKNVTVSYNLPQNFIKPTGMKSARVYFTGSNLLMIYSGNNIYDPEMNNILSYPMMAGYSLGVNIGL
ncbi:TonB-dependent receptor [Paraflavitalea soli]|uniref:TonB-dependent receptor n=1 Tax=Paraflavitalea soli TaxID=2315862 RepID=A0A3B7MI19_9BACT|nr:TonB-dependent receptor [Paraflavitalea soli]AXY73227.1 TonB-dependent receptor [Paraflavitalea soli]